MSVIFNERGVADCKPPCVAQSFINHNAILYKLYVVGDHYQMVERPSLKNFYASNGRVFVSNQPLIFTLIIYYLFIYLIIYL